MVKDEQDLMYGLDEFKFNGKSLGFIEEDSFDWGGQEGEITEIRAAQKKGYPVKIIPKSNGTIKPTFDLIQFDYENLKATMGGEIKKTGEKITGWTAPSKLVQVTGEAVIGTDSGQRITIPNCLLSAYISGNLNLTSVSKIKCKLSIAEPADGSSPFTVEDIPEGGEA